jgi:FSR family fosmidomycin resistance protein-like MFS transporter
MPTTIPAAARGHDAAVISLVAVAHGTSHIMQMALPPLFLILRGEFDVTFTQLGLFITLLYGASGLTQAGAGVLVDRYGAHRLIVLGLGVLSAAIFMCGLVPSFWMLMPLAVIAGIGNSVFHPADLALLSHRISEKRLGRAYASHGISGMLGYAVVPFLMTLLLAFVSWRSALMVLGLWGLSLTVVVHACKPILIYEDHAAKPKAGTAPAGGALTALMSPVFLTAFFYFAFSAFAGIGVQAFSITAATTAYDVPFYLAAMALTGYQVGGACGQFIGGFIAERTQKHERVAVIGVAVASILMLLMTFFAGFSWYALPAMFLAGVCYGATGPSRDALIRRAAGGTRLGGTFGFVYSGFDLGSLSAPMLFGVLLDHNLPQGVFIGIAVVFALAIPTVLEVRRRIVVRAPQAAAAE